MKIFFASDHAGYELKGKLLQFLAEHNFSVEDCGPFDYNESDDYPDYVASVASQVSKNPSDSFGVIVGGSGQGEAIMANRFPNVRAVVFQGNAPIPSGIEPRDRVTITREHNDANVLSLGSWFISEEEAKEAAVRWLSTPFSAEERHVRRLRKVEMLSPRGSDAEISSE